MILRPIFTTKLAERLQHGQAINLISPHGQGRRRTLRDLLTLLPASLPVTYIDLLRMNDERIQTTITSCSKTESPALLIVHNVNLLKTDSIIKALITTQNNNHISILCVSEHQSGDLCIQTKSMLLPPLNKQQLLAELKRRTLNLPHEVCDRILEEAAPYSALDQLMAEQEK
ncbi:MAG: hypothetical protein R8K50_03435 [Mariprofundus sp.]